MASASGIGQEEEMSRDNWVSNWFHGLIDLRGQGKRVVVFFYSGVGTSFQLSGGDGNAQ